MPTRSTMFLAGPLLALFAACAAYRPDPALSPRVNDIRLIAANLERLHPDPFRNVPPGEFRAAAAELERRADAMSEVDYGVGLVRLVASLRDAHTYARGPWQSRVFPFFARVYPDGVVVYQVFGRQNRNLLGARLVAVGDFPLGEAAERIASVITAENGPGFKNDLAYWLSRSWILEGLGLIPDARRARFTFESPTGERIQAVLPSVDLTAGGFESFGLPSPDTPGLAISLQPRSPYYSYRPIPGAAAIYLAYDRCQDDPDRPFRAFCRAMMAAVDDSGARTLIIDLRNNGGGNSSVMTPLLDALESHPRLRRPGAVMVLIGSRTFSSAQMNAVQLRDRASALLVGSPTGQKPNAFGEQRFFDLPASGWRVYHSTKRFDQSDWDPPSTMPDIWIETTAADDLAGRDPVLDAALDRAIPPRI